MNSVWAPSFEPRFLPCDRATALPPARNRRTHVVAVVTSMTNRSAARPASRRCFKHAAAQITAVGLHPRHLQQMAVTKAAEQRHCHRQAGVRRKRSSAAEQIEKLGVPDWIRTSGLRFRKPSLYPAELPGQCGQATMAFTASPRTASPRRVIAKVGVSGCGTGALLHGSSSSPALSPSARALRPRRQTWR